MMIPLAWILWGIAAIGLISLPFGIFTVLWPKQSIALYAWIMEKFNWRVSPIDEAHEIRMTRFLGLLLIFLSLAPLANFFLRNF